MSRTRWARRRALSLLELLVVVAIIAVLLALLSAAIQRARDSALRVKCANNLRQIGIALHQYHDAKGGLPPAVWSLPSRRKAYVSWIPYIFPYVGEENLHRQYNFNAPFHDPSNDSGLNQTRVTLLVCPASHAKGADAEGRGITDYAATCGVDRTSENPFLDPVPDPDGTFLGVLGQNVSRKMSEIRDGTSNTLMVAEAAGRTEVWQMGLMVSPEADARSAWANPRHRLRITGFNPATGSIPGPCAVNCLNNGEVYSFHHGGANVLFADGSVHRLFATVDINVMVSLITRERGEVIPPGIY